MSGRGGGRGDGRGSGRRGGKGRMGGPYAAGPGGDCVCLNCGYKVSHQRGVPCYNQTCPKCGSKMVRA